MRKLRLSRETIRVLGGASLRLAAGGETGNCRDTGHSWCDDCFTDWCATDSAMYCGTGVDSCVDKGCTRAK